MLLAETTSPAALASKVLLHADVSSMEEIFGGHDALDNLCNSAGSVAIGTREFLHAGWIHSHLACHCAGRAHPAVGHWPQAGGMTSDQTPSAMNFDSERLNGHNPVPHNRNVMDTQGGKQDG
jgi:hypothetical protein